jgi:hypothetical protein
MVQREWNAISNDKIANLYESTPHRVRAVLSAKGDATKYKSVFQLEIQLDM